MRVVIRLQQHGFKNHPYWYIVIAPKYSKVKGKYLEQVGYWMPRRGKTFDRSIIMNRNRIQYWLSMGAEPTEKVSKFLSNVNMWPKPVPQFGSKSFYERPQREVKDSNSLNPYNLGPFSQFMGKILEQEETSYMFRLAIQNQNYLQQFNSSEENLKALTPVQQDLKNSDEPKDLMNEIEKLKSQLNELNVSVTKLDQTKQQLLMNRINELYKAWNKESAKKDFIQINQQKENASNLFNPNVNAQNIKQRLDIERLDKKFESIKSMVDNHQQMMKPMNREEFKAYLVSNGDISDIKAETISRQQFRTARDTGMQVTRQTAYEICNPDKHIQNVSETFIKKNQSPDDKMFIPITKPITPLPDLKSYDPEDYYEIPKMVDPVSSQNKPYDLPNINDAHIPKKPIKERLTPKQTTGRKRPLRLKTRLYNTNIVNFYSTLNNQQQIFQSVYSAYMPLNNFQIQDIEKLQNQQQQNSKL